MQTQLIDLISQIEAAAIITDDDVIAVRRNVFGDGSVSIQEADALFRLNNSAIETSAAWSDCFMEAMTDFVVRQSLPYGYVDEANAAWLIQRISQDGIVETITELRLLVNVLKTAKDSPSRLVKFALSQVKAAVLQGEGVIGRGRILERGVIGAAEVQLLQDVLYASGGDKHIAITRTEAEVLFDLNDATRDAENDPAWTQLFVKGITNYLMFLTTYETPNRDEVLRREAWLKSDSSIFAGFGSLKYKDVADAFSHFFNGGPSEMETLSQNSIDNGAIARAENIDAAEAQWLMSRIHKDGQFDQNERALIAYLKTESPYLHASLTNFLNAA